MSNPQQSPVQTETLTYAEMLNRIRDEMKISRMCMDKIDHMCVDFHNALKQKDVEIAALMEQTTLLKEGKETLRTQLENALSAREAEVAPQYEPAVV